MKRIMLPLALVMVSLAGPLAGQEQDREQARDRAREALPAEVFQGIEALAGRLAEQGVPQGPLYNKALEGVAKRVPAQRLLPAVTAFSDRLVQARNAFGPGADDALLVAGADALQRGVGPEALRRLGIAEGGRGGMGRGPSAMAVLVLADLLESGVPMDRALGVLQEAMRQRAGEQAMLGITERVRRLMRQGRSPQEAVEQVRRALQRGRGGGMEPPVPPGSEPSTSGRRQIGKKKGGGFL